MATDHILYPFQAADVKFAEVAGSFLLGSEMGVGKTISILSSLDKIDGLPALVICPNSVKINWAREAMIWFSKCNPYVLTGTTLNRTKQLQQAGITVIVKFIIERSCCQSRCEAFKM